MAALLNSYRLRIACVPGRSPARNALPDRLSNSAPAFYSTSDLRVEFALLAADATTVLTDVSIAESVTVRIKASETATAALLSTAVAAADLNQALVQADWVAGTNQHGVVEFSNTETNLLAADSAAVQFWLQVFYTTTDSPAKQVTIYSGAVTVYPPEIPLDTGALSGASIIATGAVYDGAGAYSLTVIDGRRYSWTKGANDTNLVNGAETLTVTGNFTASGTTMTLNGTPSAAITAAVRAISTFTPEESDARYSRDLSLHRSSVAASATSGVTETTVATVTVPILGANDAVQFEAAFTRPASQTENTQLNVYLGGSLIAAHTLDASPFTVIPLQHLFSNRAATNVQLGGCNTAGTLLTGAVDTTATSTLLFKLKNNDAGDATTLQALTVKRIRG